MIYDGALHTNILFLIEKLGETTAIRLLTLIRQIMARFCGSSKKLAFKVGQADFLSFMVKDLKVLKRQIALDMDEGVSVFYRYPPFWPSLATQIHRAQILISLNEIH